MFAGDKLFIACSRGRTDKWKTDLRKGERTDVLTDGRTDRQDEAHNFLGTFVKICAFVNRENWIKLLKSQKHLE